MAHANAVERNILQTHQYPCASLNHKAKQSVSAGRRRYSEALQIFLQGLTAPSHVVNAITIAMFKKYALVSLIHNGEPTCGSPCPCCKQFVPCALMQCRSGQIQANSSTACGRAHSVLCYCRAHRPAAKVHAISCDKVNQVRCSGVYRAGKCIFQQKATRFSCHSREASRPFHRGVHSHCLAHLWLVSCTKRYTSI